MSTIPANLFVAVTPSVLGVGGGAIDVIGLALSTSIRVPIGSVFSFSSGSAVTSFFGSGSKEDVFANGAAGMGSGYFGGFTGADASPGSLLFAQYNQANVSAYLRGGNISAVPLATLQGYNGTLSVTIDGVLKTSSVNLSAATSFSNAAEIIANALGIEGVSVGTVTGSIGGTATTSTTTGTTLTLGALATGKLQVGDTVTANDGTNTLNATILAQLTGTPGGSAGATYTISAAATPGNLTSTTVTAKGPTMTVTALGTAPAVGVADVISGTGITANTYILAQVTPLIGGEAAGGIGRYTISSTQAGVVASETITLFTPAVQFDSLSGAFLIFSGTTGSASTITFGSGAMATNLLLTSATGAVLSQGANAATPAGALDAVYNVTQDWVTYMTLFNPDTGGANTVKQAFAAWKNEHPNRFAYVCWDPDVNARGQVPQSSTLGQILKANGDSGTFLLSELTDLNQAAFVMGTAAAIDFEETNGRTDFAFRSQAGLVADVTDGTSAVNLGGNPQVIGDFGNGYNYYGAVGAANSSFTWLQRGTVTGPFKWFDSYINQIWLNSLFQVALLTLQSALKSIPFSQAGANLIEAAMADPIQQGLTFGAYAPGNISAAQVVEVNTAAGANIAPALQAQGYYLQVNQQTSTVRANRGPWQITFWYLDRGSVQAIAVSSVALQ